jgi:hypothetical protein
MKTYNTLEELVAECRRLGVHHYRDGDTEVSILPLAPGVPAVPAASTGVGGHPGSICQCGHSPWVCNSKAPCKKGCSRNQCHPPPPTSAAKASGA